MQYTCMYNTVEQKAIQRLLRIYLMYICRLNVSVNDNTCIDVHDLYVYTLYRCVHIVKGCKYKHLLTILR